MLIFDKNKHLCYNTQLERGDYMAKVPNGMNEDYVEYFPLEEYVDRIILSPLVLEHLQDS